jgi:hypothetical protein
MSARGNRRVKGLAIIAFAHPGVPSNRCGDARAEAGGIRLLPSGAPIQDIEINYLGGRAALLVCGPKSAYWSPLVPKSRHVSG